MTNARGLTLLEILAAMAIVGVALVGLLTTIPMASYALQEGNQLSTATFLADQKLEEIRNAVWAGTPEIDCLGVSNGDAAPTSNRCHRPPSCSAAEACTTFADEPVVIHAPGYSRTVRVADCRLAPGCGLTFRATDEGLRLARVTVTYRPSAGIGGGSPDALKSVTLDLMVARR